MVRQPVSSSNIKSVGHDPRTNQLEIEFSNGKIWRYEEVNVDEHRALMSAKSIGSHFHNVIKSAKTGIEVSE